MSTPSPSESDFLLETLRLAGHEVMRHFARRVVTRSKSDSSLVTDADVGSERLIIDRIRTRFPTDVIFAEESGVADIERIAGQRVWVIDPLDGTTNFAHGYPFFSVSIARGHFDADGRIQIDLGGITDPVHQRTWWAQKGRGAFVNAGPDRPHKPLGPTEPCAPKDAFLVTGFYYFRDEALARELGNFQRISSLVHAVRRDGSAALDLAFVAEGIYDGFWERGLKLWDVAAGALIVEESRRVVRNYGNAERPFDIEGEGLVAGDPTLVSTLVGLIT